MADISKINDVTWDSVAKVSGGSKESIASIGGTSAPAGAPVWLAVSTGARFIYSENAGAISGSWSSFYQISGISTDCTGLAYGKDNNDNDRWIVTWDRGNNLASVASVSVPTESADWAFLDLDTGTWGSSQAANSVAYTNATNPPVWAIVGNGGRVAYSSTGSSTTSDWEVDINTTAGFAGNRSIEAVCFSGSHMFLAGARTRIVSGSVPDGWTIGTNISWGTSDRCLDESDSVGNSQFAWYDIAAAGSGDDARIWAVADSTRTDNFPVFATGSLACCGDFDDTVGWRDIINYPTNTFGDNSDSTQRRMRAVVGDGQGNWMIVGLEGQLFRSTNNGSTWSQVTGPNNPNGQSWADTNVLALAYASAGGTDTWVMGGEDGYMAVSTDIGASWTAIPNAFSDAGTGVNYNIQAISFNAVKNWPGATP
tara:strand:- start:351 stop:1625 length:1275 start_codon:yes stop_codon:yes gene_type:complete